MLEAFPKSLGSGPFGAGDEHAALTACNFEAELSKSMPPRISRAACSIERSLGSGSAVSTVQNILQCPDARAHLTPEEKSVELWGIRVGRRLLKPQTVTWLRDVLQEGELTRSAIARELCERDGWKNRQGVPWPCRCRSRTTGPGRIRGECRPSPSRAAWINWARCWIPQRRPFRSEGPLPAAGRHRRQPRHGEPRNRHADLCGECRRAAEWPPLETRSATQAGTARNQPLSPAATNPGSVAQLRRTPDTPRPHQRARTHRQPHAPSTSPGTGNAGQRPCRATQSRSAAATRASIPRTMARSSRYACHIFSLPGTGRLVLG